VKFGFIAKHRGVWPADWLCEALEEVYQTAGSRVTGQDDGIGERLEFEIISNCLVRSFT
jgi:hypothetical protein